MLVDMHSQLVKVSGNGKENDEEVLEILKSAAEDGITHMIATPLYNRDFYANQAATIEKSIKQLNVKLQDLDIPVTVFEGMEIILYEKIVKDLALDLLPLAGSHKYVFVSFQDISVPAFALNTFFEMQMRGYVPIIANVDRNKALIHNKALLREFVEKGALVHVSAASILGGNGGKIRRRILKLSREGLIHIISSASSNGESGPSLLKPAYKYLEKKLSIEAVAYFTNNAKSVVDGSDFHIKTF